MQRMKLIFSAIIAAFLSACVSLTPEDEIRLRSSAERLNSLISKAELALDKFLSDSADKENVASGEAYAPASAENGPPNPVPDAEADAQPSESADAIDFSKLKFCWGGFGGSKAKISGRARIKNLKVTGKGISYGWEAGGCEDLGAANASDASCLACLFVEDGRGGKFDWISTSRRTRDLKNIESGYGGWDASAFKASKRFYFCIVSKDGKTRTNVIEASR